jgi:hypothetical protein
VHQLALWHSRLLHELHQVVFRQDAQISPLFHQDAQDAQDVQISPLFRQDAQDAQAINLIILPIIVLVPRQPKSDAHDHADA